MNQVSCRRRFPTPINLPAILEAVLSDIGVHTRKTSEIGALVSLVADAGRPLPTEFEALGAQTPFGAIYHYEDYDAPVSLDRIAAPRILRQMLLWVESKLRERTPPTVA